MIFKVRACPRVCLCFCYLLYFSCSDYCIFFIVRILFSHCDILISLSLSSCILKRVVFEWHMTDWKRNKNQKVMYPKRRTLVTSVWPCRPVATISVKFKSMGQWKLIESERTFPRPLIWSYKWILGVDEKRCDKIKSNF